MNQRLPSAVGFWLRLGLICGALVGGAVVWPEAAGAQASGGSQPGPVAAGAERTAGESAEEQARRSMELTRGIMSPFCPGRTLDGCSSSQAGAWRDDIRRWVAEGKTSSEIRKLLAERADEDLSGAPSTVLDSVLPILVSVIALLLLILLLRMLLKPARTPAARPKKRRRDANAAPTKHETSEDYDKRLDDELDGLDD